MEVNLLLQSLIPHAAALMHSCTLHGPGNTSVLFNQPCLQGSTVLEHQRDMHIQQRMCPAVQSCWLQIRAGKPKLQRCSGHDTLLPASFPCLLSVQLEMPYPVCITDMPEVTEPAALLQNRIAVRANREVVQQSPLLTMAVGPWAYSPTSCRTPRRRNRHFILQQAASPHLRSPCPAGPWTLPRGT